MKKLHQLALITLASLLFGFAHAQTDQELGLHSEGGPWKFYPAGEKNDHLKNVLLIGNSVMNGYHGWVIDSLKEIANVDYWLTPKHLKSEHLFSDLAKVVSSADYDVIQFNIGLHGWPKGRILEDEYVPLLEQYVQTLEENAKNSKLIWASITPVTEKGKAELNREINPTITKRNGLAAGVMERHQIPINDLYGLVSDKLHLAKLDQFHWTGAGYQLMAKQTVQHVLKELERNKPLSRLKEYNVLWKTPSVNSLGSMPAGNGDIGINLWVEENGDLLFYLAKTDAWSENARLLKLGKIRLALSPNPFTTGSPFSQELMLQDGLIRIEAGTAQEQVSIEVRVDANHPVVELDVSSLLPISASITTEPWRNERRIITATELHSAYGLTGDPQVYVEKDSVVENSGQGVLWVHRNERSIWEENLRLQDLGDFIPRATDPLLKRTFGGLIRSEELKKGDPGSLKSPNPLKHFSISVYALTAQTGTLDDFMQQLNKLAKGTVEISKDQRLADHKSWWQCYWNQSYIHVSSNDASDKEKVFQVARGYALQRYMNACSGRGNSPIKFNGSIFTVDTKDLQGKYNGFDADYRQWGGPYWWQNTRLPYWSMLESGDFELMLPLFKLFHEALDLRKFATQKYYQHGGVFFPETQYFWGSYTNSNYGLDRTELPSGMTQNRYIRYYWQGGLELSLMMLDYYNFTQDDKLLKETLLPVISEVILFFDQHWGRDENGKILFDPAMALETYNTAVNPLPEIVGIRKVCTELLNLPESIVTPVQRAQFNRLISELPEIPMRTVDGEILLAPAYEYSGKQNVENPELYAIFPYRIYGLGKDGIDLARKTFEQRAIKETGGWQQNAIKAAYLGLTEEAAELMAQNFNTSNMQFRFPVMWGPNYDWIPDQDHGSVAMIALQRMLLQYDGDDLILFPSWPKNWDVEFKLHAPQKTVIEGKLHQGEITNLKVTPQERARHMKIEFSEK